jgi:hypothetical protein
VSLLRRVSLVVIAAGSLLVGVWAQGFPRSFYGHFPGLGHAWVAVDGPYNEHLVRDVGGLNLALASVAIIALFTGSAPVARAAGVAALVFGVPHLAYHVTHLDPFSAADAAGIVVSLAVTTLAGALALGGLGAAPDAR